MQFYACCLWNHNCNVNIYICTYFQTCPRVLGLEHFCPWPRSNLSSATQSLVLASDFFRVLGFEGFVLDSTSVENLVKSKSTTAFWADHKWNTKWQKNTYRLHTFIPTAGPSPSGMTLPRPSWVRLNRLRTGVGLFRSTMRTSDAEQRNKQPKTY